MGSGGGGGGGYVFGPRGQPRAGDNSVCPAHAQTRTDIMLGRTPPAV